MADFSFIDLFAGIGGIRIGFENAGGNCVFSSEYDKFAQVTYETYFGDRPDFSEILSKEDFERLDRPGDITALHPSQVPDHDVLVGGFPCQPFSLAGVSKKQSLGKPHGFEDPTQGTLFFNVKEIITEKRPKAFLLENVKNLKGHDKGRTYQVIRSTLEGLGYSVFDRVIDAAGWVPQHRERIFIVGFRKPESSIEPQKWSVDSFDFDSVAPNDARVDLAEVIEPSVPEKYTLGPGTWRTLERHKAHHAAKGQGFGYGMIKAPYSGQVTRTLSARYHKDGAEILIYQKGKRPRRLTPLECARLMGFPSDFQKMYNRINGKQPVSDTQAYRQFGNSVAVPVVKAIASIVVRTLKEHGALGG